MQCAMLLGRTVAHHRMRAVHCDDETLWYLFKEMQHDSIARVNKIPKSTSIVVYSLRGQQNFADQRFVDAFHPRSR